jgi:hypothetical protein
MSTKEQITSWITSNKKLVIAIAAVIVVAVVALIVCLNTFTCHGVIPELDFGNAEKALEDTGYSVVKNYRNKLDIGIKKELYAKSNDYDDEITIIVFEDLEYAKKRYELIKHSYETQIKSTKLRISIIEYQLDNYYNELSSYKIDDLEDELEKLRETLEKYEEDYVYGRSGNIVWYGTTQAAEDSWD